MAQEEARLPDAVIEHIYSDALDAWYRSLFREEVMSENERVVVEEAVSDVYHKRVTLDAFRERLAEAFVEPRGTAIAIAVLGNDLLAIEDYLGVDIAAYITHLGGDPAQFVHEVSLDELVAEIAERFAGAVPDAPSRRRLDAALESFLVNARTPEQTQAVLVRGPKIGGVGLEASVARQVVEAVAARKQWLAGQRTRIVRTARPTPASSFTLVKPVEAGLIQPEDEAEIADVRATHASTSVLDIPAAVDRVVARCGATFRRAEVERQFRAVVASRLRDVRDRTETANMLTRPQAQGGLGIPQAIAAKVLAVVEQEYGRHHGVAERRVPARAKVARPTSAVRALERAQSAPTTPIAIQPKPKPTLPPSPPPIVKVERKEVHVPASGGDIARPISVVRVPQPEQRSPQARVERVVPAPAPRPVAEVRARAAPPAPPQAPARLLPIPAPVVLPAVRQDITPAVQVALPTAPPSMPSTGVPTARAKVQDIRHPRPRLVGPIEELEQLTASDLRKIAKDPGAAADRIFEKLDLLERQSYAKRAQGITALRRSPLMATYADALNAAFIAGKRVEECLGDLTEAEFHALAGLNAKIRM